MWEKREVGPAGQGVGKWCVRVRGVGLGVVELAVVAFVVCSQLHVGGDGLVCRRRVDVQCGREVVGVSVRVYVGWSAVALGGVGLVCRRWMGRAQ